MNRRGFLRKVVGCGGVLLAWPLLGGCTGATSVPRASTGTPAGRATAEAEATSESTARPSPTAQPAQPIAEKKATAQVVLVKTGDRVAGIQKAVDLYGLDGIQGKELSLKPNLNSADPFPGSTHNDTLRVLVQRLQGAGAGRITVGDRSGMGDTRRVMEQKGVLSLADALGFETLVFDELEADDWEAVQVPGSHWARGFALPRPVLEADGIVQTCCLKTHRFGGHFTLSLKNSVGFAAKWVPGEGYNYMSELHSSPHQRIMIAEINAAYVPDLIVLDGVEAFVNGGPDKGKQVPAEAILVGRDRVAIDAVGVAILRHWGTTAAVSQGPVFQQEQIARAVELGLGVGGPEEIELVTDDPDSRAYADQIEQVLLQG